jgi:hypothetical protein
MRSFSQAIEVRPFRFSEAAFPASWSARSLPLPHHQTQFQILPDIPYPRKSPFLFHSCLISAVSTQTQRQYGETHQYSHDIVRYSDPDHNLGAVSATVQSQSALPKPPL